MNDKRDGHAAAGGPNCEEDEIFPKHIERVAKTARRRSWRRSALFGPVLLITIVMLSSGCGGSGAAIKQLNEARGKFSGSQGRIVLIVNPGVASPQRLGDDLDPVVSQATTDGARLRAFVLNGGSAASMTEVRFSMAAGGGDFYPPGANSAAWHDAAAAFRKAAIDDLRPALVPDDALTATGNDLAGALRDAMATVRAMPGTGPRQIVIVTGGGVQRTAQLDLIALRVAPSNAAALAGQTPRIDPDGIDVEMVGVGRFEGLSVDPVFADGVLAWWRTVCPLCHFR